MAVFTALRNKAQSAASGFLTKTATSALGLDRAKGLRFPSSSTSPVTGGPTTNRGGQVLQYPLDLGSDGNSHFIAFFVKTVEPATIKVAENDGTAKTDAKARKNVTQETGAGGAAIGSQKISESKKIAAANKKTFGGKPHLSIQERKRPTSKLVKTIALYFPPSVQQSYNLSYNEQEIGKAAAFGAEVIQAFVDKGFNIDSFNAASAPAFAGVKAIINDMGIKALDNVAPGSSALIAINRGKVLAPRMELMFEGIGKRSFTYSFTFTPSSEAEANMVFDIIKTFRFHAASKYTDSLGFELAIPDQFEIEYYTKSSTPNGYMNRIGTCVLESVDVTYGGEKMTWHETNAKGASPTKTTMALSFKELSVVTKDTIEEGF